MKIFDFGIHNNYFPFRKWTGIVKLLTGPPLGQFIKKEHYYESISFHCADARLFW